MVRAALMIGVLIVVGIAAIFVAVRIFVRRFRGSLNLDPIPGLTGATGGAGQGVGNGIPGSGLVTSVRDTGVTINNIRAAMKVGLRSTVEGRAPHDVDTRVTIGRRQFGILQPGVTMSVWVDPADPGRVARGAWRVAQEVLSTDDILARGIPGEGEIRSATHTGATAQQMAPGHQLGSGEHDDPMVHLVMTVTPSNGAAFQTQAIVRVPDGMLGQLTIGRKVPVACLPNRQTAAIDWKAPRYYRG